MKAACDGARSRRLRRALVAAGGSYDDGADSFLIVGMGFWQGEAHMLFLTAALLLAAGLFYWAAANAHHSVVWADRLCTQAQFLCDQPWWLLIAAGFVIAVAAAGRRRKTRP